MRVIAGSAKGRKLHAPKGQAIRPTSDRVKEAVFNIIGGRVNDANVLDLFAGTGGFGIEALSRGAKETYFIDTSNEAVRLIKKNLEATGLGDTAIVIKADANKAIKRLVKDGAKFDLIFLDPPYRISVSFLNAILFTLGHHVLQSDGLLVLEHSAKIEPRAVEGLDVESTRVYGDTAVTFYSKKDQRGLQ
ncbi:MAG: 16S rRNA (guanine(966)-N(2))-methyltransferase RsmD [Candidatus Aquicultor secundus]|uniref:16S rRNA (Guanine(966)-N(2))-methyltransferase RsmD n=1 Tax=Candidatus Aquicultor secundus TaxID=1973895 RepID=A0A2M7T825_9ACTN|nr:16S rRNA (guanine(966)-N(2))-methyltransferase RsmD [Candidatus Aquicultor secundus]NCO66794.1 16S rRNA (guanine(966)-N(2))-methyltransferase RsmD [Solirubrobacter sp.]OIO86181.1 MAG: 16S rRNA (guanine(966)-N(2))-methyltransferase RsmD [Candidatus Aquicultor secundus]PIU27570.1 MAG: 16S rRNA (guanine(966)-N(2))-methyltransferase RsmD [Candidatus Aquicultor secundus]PIW22512.1 MAG: 16S rRNA (guanine(966)-N(2))-methyltransferase RsmD [Candidatus Aquicultor secundus]PIX51273.1 MAG: 16S rRNA (g